MSEGWHGVGSGWEEGEGERPGVDSTGFLLGEPLGLAVGECSEDFSYVEAVELLVREHFLDGFCHEEIPDGGDEGGAKDSDGGFSSGELLVYEF